MNGPKAGKSKCKWSSCREGCTVDMFKCFQVRVLISAHCENLTNFFHFLGPEFLQPEMTFENHRFAKLNETIES